MNYQARDQASCCVRDCRPHVPEKRPPYLFRLPLDGMVLEHQLEQVLFYDRGNERCDQLPYRQISLLSMERKSREHRRDEFGVAVFSFRRDNTGGTARRYREVGRKGLGRKQPHHADFCERAVSPAPRQVAMRLKCGSRGHRDR